MASLFFDTDLLSPRIQAPLATFKAVLIALDMTIDKGTPDPGTFGKF